MGIRVASQLDYPTPVFNSYCHAATPYTIVTTPPA